MCDFLLEDENLLVINIYIALLKGFNMICFMMQLAYDCFLFVCRIGGKILQLETFTQSEVIRKRFRYLSHFPLTTTFQVMHCMFLEFWYAWHVSNL